uniref:Uncharacterized LOC100176919 n=1 Tax=Ciona intestinalis TaxID=7719 RepID=F6PZ24_CIOIN|nr:uncharacterized protein LOC100176919 [Ciona intestinalis]|eukprot:XP_002130338.1 uncharacterized protein LOC100176919 [Ciona intestinalis]
MQLLLLFLVFLQCACAQEGYTSEDMSQQLYGTKFANEFFRSLQRGSLLHEFGIKTYVAAGSTECYFQYCAAGAELVVGFEMATSGGVANKGLLSGYVSSPNGTRLLVSSEPKNEQQFEVECAEKGVYEFCLDNTGDHLFPKLAYFHIVVLNKQLFTTFHESVQNSNESETFMTTMYQVFDKVFHINKNWMVVKMVQHHKEAMKHRDIDTLVSNAWRVSSTAMATIMVTLFVGLAQVYSVRRMFNEKSGKGKTALRL